MDSRRVKRHNKYGVRMSRFSMSTVTGDKWWTNREHIALELMKALITSGNSIRESVPAAFEAADAMIEYQDNE